MQVITFLTILLLGLACNVPVKKDLPKEKEPHSPVLKMALSIPGFGQFWKIQVEIFGWGREKQVSTFLMEKHLLIIRNIKYLVFCRL